LRAEDNLAAPALQQRCAGNGFAADPTSSQAGLPGRITDGNDALQYIFPTIFVPRDIPKRSKAPIVAQISRLPGDQIKELRGMGNADQQNV
jgi:hypothetical protein